MDEFNLNKFIINEIIKRDAPIERKLEELTATGCHCCGSKDSFCLAYGEMHEFLYIFCENCEKKYYVEGDD